MFLNVYFFKILQFKNLTNIMTLNIQNAVM